MHGREGARLGLVGLLALRAACQRPDSAWLANGQPAGGLGSACLPRPSGFGRPVGEFGPAGYPWWPSHGSPITWMQREVVNRPPVPNRRRPLMVPPPLDAP